MRTVSAEVHQTSNVDNTSLLHLNCLMTSTASMLLTRIMKAMAIAEDLLTPIWQLTITLPLLDRAACMYWAAGPK